MNGLEIFSVKKKLTNAQVLALNTTPIVLVDAPGADKAIVPINVSAQIIFDAPPYITNLNLQVEANNSNEVFYEGTILGANGDSHTFLDHVDGAVNDDQIVANEPLQATVETGDPANGDSEVVLFVVYVIISTL